MYTDYIYDFDGTIADSYPLYTETMLEILKRHGLDDTYESAYARLKISIGNAIRSYNFTDATQEELNHEFHTFYRKLAKEKLAIIKGADEMLKKTVEAGKKNYLYTHTGKLVYELLEKNGLSDYFVDIIDASMKFPRKPDPTALNWLIDRHSIVKENALMIGDRDIDIIAAHNAGIAGCLFDEGGYFENTNAEHRIKGLDEVLDLI